MTYKKIADLANVSLSTVSKALSSSDEISDELRAKIIKIAIDCGYFAEKGKRKIEYSKENGIIVAIICPEIVSVAYAGEITAIKNELEQRGAVTAVYVYDFDEQKLEHIIKTVTVGNRADGIILFDSAPIEKTNGIPIVAIGAESGICDSVFVNENDYFCKIVRHLKDLGHRKIAFVGEKHTAVKFAAYKNALAENGIPFDENDVYIINERFEDIGYTACEKMLQKNQLPTAVICAYDEIALALIRDFSKSGIAVPEQLSVVGINDIPMASYASVPLTTVRTHREKQAKTAVKLLYDRIFDKTDKVQHISAEFDLIVRNSTAPAVKE